MIPPDTDALLDQVPLLADRVLVEELEGGLTNTNLKVTAPGAVYVVRISGRDADLLAIDRGAEHVNTARAHEAGVGAPVHAYRPDLGLLVIGWVEGRTLVDEDFTDPGVLRRAAEACRRLHAGPAFGGEFDMFARQATYARTVWDHGFRRPDAYADHGEAWERVRRALGPRQGAALAPCNNDLLAGNFIDDGRRVSLIDYEYSGTNDPSFELGNTVTECEFTAEMTEAYVEAYFGQVRRRDLARVRLQALCSEYGWALWGFIQAGIVDPTTTDFDYYGWGLRRYEKAARTFTSDGFDSLLAEAADA